jgi:TonB family protein
MELGMLHRNVLLSTSIVLNAGLLLCQAGNPQSPGTVPQHSPTGAVDPVRASIVLELDRAILVLKRGLKENWATRDQYLTAFEKTPGTDQTGRPVTDAKSYVDCVISEHVRNPQVWDEGVPIEVEVQGTIDEFIERREGQALSSQPSSCAYPVPRKVTISAAEALRMLNISGHSVYPPEVGAVHIDGIVVLHTTINAKGIVEALSVISGPASLRQAALDAVRHWTYRPYLLNNKPVEVETTINIIFRRNR